LTSCRSTATRPASVRQGGALHNPLGQHLLQTGLHPQHLPPLLVSPWCIIQVNVNTWHTARRAGRLVHGCIIASVQCAERNCFLTSLFSSLLPAYLLSLTCISNASICVITTGPSFHSEGNNKPTGPAPGKETFEDIQDRTGASELDILAKKMAFKRGMKPEKKIEEMAPLIKELRWV